jgi:hypothetical protein
VAWVNNFRIADPGLAMDRRPKLLAPMANLADAIQGLVQHMRSEQQMIREWADGQGEQSREIRKLLERIARQPERHLSGDM